jgi:hypothetical protein
MRLTALVLAAIFPTALTHVSAPTSPNGVRRDHATQAVRLSDALIVLPGASAVKHTTENLGVVLYQLSEPYPASKAIAAIRTNLEEKMGWDPLADDILNPGLRNSFSRGWTEYKTSVGPSKYVYQWFAQWEDASGKVAWYILTYDGTEITKSNFRPEGPLHVRATILSSEEVRRIRRSTMPGNIP